MKKYLHAVTAIFAILLLPGKNCVAMRNPPNPHPDDAPALGLTLLRRRR